VSDRERRARRAAVLRPARPGGPGDAGAKCVCVLQMRDDGRLQVICPTCQNVFAESHMPAAAKLLCMGLFSIFWVREPRRPCGWPAGPELAAAPAIPTLPLPPGSLRPLARRRNQKGQPLCPSFGVAVSCLSRLKRSRWCSRQRTVNGLGRDWWALPKGPAMLIRSTRFGVRGGEANTARTLAIPAASLPTLLIGGLLLLSCP
jgi:hypothetical protein